MVRQITSALLCCALWASSALYAASDDKPSGSDALKPPLDEPPFSAGVPERLVPSRVVLKLQGFSERDVREVPHSLDSARKLASTLREIEQRHDVDLRFVRALSFGWALYDLLPAGDHRRASEEVTRELIARLHRDPLVRASEDRWVHPFATPNDPGMSYLWHYESIGTRAGWDVTTGLSTQRVGVVDTGTVVTHQDLAAKVVDGYDFIYETDFSVDGDGRDDDFTDPGDGGNCGYGYMDHSWHGSHVAGTIVASTNNGVGIAGLSWGAKLVTGRALGRCGGTTVDIFEAMAWMSGYAIEGVPNLAAANVVDVVNLSLGADEACSDVEADYIGTILAQTDVVIVAAAGNSGNGVPVSSPANCPGVLSVGAFGPGANRPLANYSNFSADLDIVAPGGDDNEGVLSACGGSNDCYQYQAGTSMAAPHIAGAVSLLRAVNPTLSQDDIRTVLRSTGATCTGCGNIPALQLDAAVREAALMAGGTGVPAAAPEPVPSPTPEPATEPDEEPGPAPEPSPVDGSVGACDPRRGNWDCANGEGCVENAAGVAECRAGAEGESKSGGLCDLDDDCASGLCDRGVCTVPCDAGCRDGYSCDEEAIPGGLCRPDSCAASEGEVCSRGWHCTYTAYSRYVCALDGDDVFASSGCSSVRKPSFPVMGLLFLLGLAPLVRRRGEQNPRRR